MNWTITLLSLAWPLLRAALQQLMVSLITERLLKDVVITALEKLSKRSDNHVDDEVVHLIKRSLYPDFEAGEPPEDPADDFSTADKKKPKK